MNKVCSSSAENSASWRIQPAGDSSGGIAITNVIESKSDPTELQGLLVHLNAKDRQLVSWHHLDGLSHQDIARAAGYQSGFLPHPVVASDDRIEAPRPQEGGAPMTLTTALRIGIAPAPLPGSTGAR